MNLTNAELNELIYCVARTIGDDPKGWNVKLKMALHDKLYSELEGRINQIQQTIDEYAHLRDYEPDEEEITRILDEEAREREIMSGEWDYDQDQIQDKADD